jgi:alanyl-tRNA synthetase
MKTSAQVRRAFLDYFRQQGHEIVASGSLIPANDPTLMFANAGMVQFKDVFTGREKRAYVRAASSQKCMRVSGKHNDLENVGVTARHHTLFEMLGNFSFGDYFKADSIRFGWQFITEVLGLSRDKLMVTYFGGEAGLPADEEARDLWRKTAGLPEDRIRALGASDNFWSMGDTGPCGPSSEIFYYFGEDTPDPRKLGDEPGEDGSGWVEIWNHVFMQFERASDGTLTPLPAPSIDTGMGLERICCAVQNVRSNYDTDLLRPIVELASEIARKPYGASLSPDDVSMRVIADHARATAFLIAEGVFPDREGRPYVLRRVMRRAIRHGHRLGINEPFLHRAALRVVELMGEHYPELRERRALIEDVTRQEEERFRRTLDRGLAIIAENKEWDLSSGHKRLPGAIAFKLYDTYGFPLDLQQVIGDEQGFAIDQAGFESAMEQARERSAGSKLAEKGIDRIYHQLVESVGKTEFVGYDQEDGTSKVVALLRAGVQVDALQKGEEGELITQLTPFYGESGGQVGDKGTISTADGVFEVLDTLKPVDGLVVHRGRVRHGSIKQGEAATLAVDPTLRAATRRNHSATHLLHLGLRTVLGEQAMQKGSLVGPDRLRFDYSGTRALTQLEIEHIENIVNDRVLANYKATTHVLPMAEAKARGAIGIFEEKYGEVVRMLHMADSLELCGGTHVTRTGDIGSFKILSEAGIAAGVRRIEATTGMNAVQFGLEVQRELARAAELLKATPFQTFERVEKLLAQRKELQREVEQLKKQLITGGGARDLTAGARKAGDVSVLGAIVDIADPVALRELADQLRDKLAPAVIVLGAKQSDDKVVLVCTVSKELTARFKAGQLIKEVAAIVSGTGGGRPDFAQAGGSDPSKLESAVARVYDLVS